MCIYIYIHVDSRHVRIYSCLKNDVSSCVEGTYDPLEDAALSLPVLRPCLTGPSALLVEGLPQPVGFGLADMLLLLLLVESLPPHPVLILLLLPLLLPIWLSSLLLLLLVFLSSPQPPDLVTGLLLSLLEVLSLFPPQPPCLGAGTADGAGADEAGESLFLLSPAQPPLLDDCVSAKSTTRKDV